MDAKASTHQTFMEEMAKIRGGNVRDTHLRRRNESLVKEIQRSSES